MVRYWRTGAAAFVTLKLLLLLLPDDRLFRLILKIRMMILDVLTASELAVPFQRSPVPFFTKKFSAVIYVVTFLMLFALSGVQHSFDIR